MYVEDGVHCAGSTIGPNVSILTGTSVINSTVVNSVIGAKTKIDGCAIANSLIGDRVTIVGLKGEVTIGDDSELRVTA